VATVAGLERIYAEANNVRRASKVGPVRTGGKGTGTGAVRADRAAPRPLRPEAVAHLSAHPGKEFTPGEIAKVLGRSSGAVANALETLAKNGEAVLVSERPARYTAPTTDTTTAGDSDASYDTCGPIGGETGNGPAPDRIGAVTARQAPTGTSTGSTGSPVPVLRDR
jgi:hypothetical protein